MEYNCRHGTGGERLATSLLSLSLNHIIISGLSLIVKRRLAKQDDLAQVQHGGHHQRDQPVQEHLQLVRLPSHHALLSSGHRSHQSGKNNKLSPKVALDFLPPCLMLTFLRRSLSLLFMFSMRVVVCRSTTTTSPTYCCPMMINHH